MSLCHWIYHIVSAVIKGHWRGCSSDLITWATTLHIQPSDIFSTHLNYPNSAWTPTRSISSGQITIKMTLPFIQQWNLVNSAALISVKWCGFVKHEGTKRQTSRFIADWTAPQIGGRILVMLLVVAMIPLCLLHPHSIRRCDVLLVGVAPHSKINQISMTHCWSPCFGSNPKQLLEMFHASPPRQLSIDSSGLTHQNS